MKVSLITVALNRVATLGDTLNSILNQTYSDIECIVIDGGSTDGSIELLKGYQDRFGDKLRWTTGPDKGLYDAMNRGLAAATGDIVGFINADDFYHRNDIIERIVASIQSNTSIDAVYGDVIFVSRYNRSNIVRYYSSANFHPWKFRFGFMPAHPTFFTYKRFYDQFGGFKADYKISADFDLLLRFIGNHKLRTKYIGTDFLTMRTGGISTSSVKNTYILNQEVHRACSENGVKTYYILLYSRYLKKIFEWLPYFFKNSK